MTAYETLLCETRPEVIETDGLYDAEAARLAELVRRGKRRTDGESRLILAVLRSSPCTSAQSVWATWTLAVSGGGIGPEARKLAPMFSA